ncbi:glycosyltransferase [Chryseobacterium sp.]|uniref:glycosyltransferase n=1 Tax=Chryseobacterium sp. TaxID=1871047 RepID=UPI00388DA584
MENLKANRRYFEKCIKIAHLLFQEGLYEDCAQYIQKIGQFAWLHHTGYYASRSLEYLLFLISSKLPVIDKDKIRLRSRSNEHQLKILHVFSEIYTFGGHSKLLFKWINIDSQNKHSILSTRQPINEIKNVATSFHSRSDIDLYTVINNSILESANLLKDILYKDFDIIVLHTHPNDVISNIAFSDPNIDIPIAYLNHADHVFWYGVSISDCVIQIREANIELDKERRGLLNQYFLPIPIRKDEYQVKKNNSDFINLVTVGTDYKYNPVGDYNFFEEALSIVSKYDNVIFNFVGISPSSDFALKYSHERIVYHGVLLPDELNIFLNNMDLYIEGFPIPSFTALLEPAMKGIPFVLHYNPSNLLRLFKDNIDSYIFYPKTIVEWRDNVGKLILNEPYRDQVGKKQFAYVNRIFGEDSWLLNLNFFYRKVISTNKSSFSFSEENNLFEGRDEKELLGVHNIGIDHFTYTRELSLKNRLYVLYCYKYRTEFVFSEGWKIYIRSTFLFKILRKLLKK